MECQFYMKNEYIPENKQIFVYGFKLIKTDKIDTYIIIGRELNELYEIDKLFNFWSNNFMNKEITMRNFKLIGWPFINLDQRNIFFSKSRPLFVVENDVEFFHCCLLRKLFI